MILTRPGLIEELVAKDVRKVRAGGQMHTPGPDDS